MPRIKKSEVNTSEPIKNRAKSDMIQVKRIHRKTTKQVEAPKEVVIPISSLLPVEEIKEVEDPVVEEVQKEIIEEVPEEISDEVAQKIKTEFLSAPRTSENSKNKIQKIEKEVKTTEQKKNESAVCCRCVEPDFTFSPSMIKILNSLMFFFASSILIGLNLLILVFFAWLIAGMLH